MIYFKLEDFKLYKAKRLRTKRPVAEIRYKYYKYKLVQCLFKEWESRYQIKKRKQIISNVKLSFISKRLFTNSLSHM